MTWSADGRTMYWIDTATNAVDAFDFDPAAGALSNRRTVVTCPRQGTSVHGAVGGVPDGMTIDSAGKLWVVLGESGCVVQARSCGSRSHHARSDACTLLSCAVRPRHGAPGVYRGAARAAPNGMHLW